MNKNKEKFSIILEVNYKGSNTAPMLVEFKSPEAAIKFVETSNWDNFYYNADQFESIKKLLK